MIALNIASSLFGPGRGDRGQDPLLPDDRDERGLVVGDHLVGDHVAAHVLARTDGDEPRHGEGAVSPDVDDLVLDHDAVGRGFGVVADVHDAAVVIAGPECVDRGVVPGLAVLEGELAGPDVLELRSVVVAETQVLLAVRLHDVDGLGALLAEEHVGRPAPTGQQPFHFGCEKALV